ncbi:TetR/AcrR family transcriptional regulator [Streptomyces sp. enrichment culture]|uniref:TetR/AcrR family transcriptional regulator n=1 Tax=Streptomyces sp. enrichment culture TaxID=1795815 RepID=UPI003F564616
MNARAPGRPRILSRERIVTVARRIADEEGLDALTVRRVAQRLGTGQASLYRHIEDRDELLRLLAEDVAVHLPAPKEHLDVHERVVEQWLDAYDYLSHHRWAARIIAEGEHVADSASTFAEGALDALRALAGDAKEARADLARVYRVLWHLLLGHVLNVHPVGHAHSEDAGPRSAGESEDTDAAPAPNPDEASTPRDDLAWALPRVLDGMLGTP